MPPSRESVEDALRRGFLGGHALRTEDVQKVRELVPLLAEIARFTHSRTRAHVVVDAAAGKAALGVLAAALVLEDDDRVIAIEREPARRDRAESAARILGVEARVAYREGDVADPSAWPREPDLVVALHACGAASDAVIDAAIDVDARVLLLVPCCYAGGPRHAPSTTAQPAARSSDAVARDEVAARDQFVDAWRARIPLPDHGLVGRRFAQALIDAERTLRLEAHGYQTEVVEIFSPQVSPYNFLWRARRVREPVRMEHARRRHGELVLL